MFSRSFGLLSPLTALPSEEGVGTFGEEAYHFVDLLSSNHVSLWQILPLNPVGYGNSPYQPYSSFALDEIYVSLSSLQKQGRLTRLYPFPGDPCRVDYPSLRRYKRKYLQEAYQKNPSLSQKEASEWLKTHDWGWDWCVFTSLHWKNGKAWSEWEKKQRDWISSPSPLDPEIEKEALFQAWVQAMAEKQWKSLRGYAKKKGVTLIGDLPFYVGFDSLDVWGNQKEFLLAGDPPAPSFVAGVPPDYFSPTGQRWGNPIYDWKKMKDEGFSFLMERLLRSFELYDVVRLDHFRAFDTYWKIPSSCPTAEEGEWVEAPGKPFFKKLFEAHPEIKGKLIAEDLGLLRKEVGELRDELGFPGMDVVQFTFEDSEFHFNPHWNKKNSVCYLGTHDNPTTLSFLEEMDPETKQKWAEALKKKGVDQGSLLHRLIELGMKKQADWFLLSLPDLLELGEEGRINTPSTVQEANWSFRACDMDKMKEKLEELAPSIVSSGRSL